MELYLQRDNPITQNKILIPELHLSVLEILLGKQVFLLVFFMVKYA